MGAATNAFASRGIQIVVRDQWFHVYQLHSITDLREMSYDPDSINEFIYSFMTSQKLKAVNRKSFIVLKFLSPSLALRNTNVGWLATRLPWAKR
jgi:hypothetical protein